MITGAHAMFYSPDADATRAFLRDVVGFDSVDAGGGWLIFKLPPAELGVHPSDGASVHELYLVCDDIDATIKELRGRGAVFEDDGKVTHEIWGSIAYMAVPGGGRLGVYEVRHPSAI
jgi:catechol 2,3-dioxygenase-like lactoylglutathione lyase family enzyme